VALVATVRPIKDHATFLRAARLVLDRHPGTRFFAIGKHEPPYFTELQSLADELNIAEHVRWFGPVDNPLSILAHCDLGVLSSRSEGFSNALLDYAVAGLATVATDVGGTPEVVEDGRTGFLVPPQSPERMADRICQLLQDAPLRQAFGARAAARAGALFSEQRILNQYSQLYLHLAGKTATASSPIAISDQAGVAQVSNSAAGPS
jgi:glycosyltransferase involved in cell wall biosynthesis